MAQHPFGAPHHGVTGDGRTVHLPRLVRGPQQLADQRQPRRVADAQPAHLRGGEYGAGRVQRVDDHAQAVLDGLIGVEARVHQRRDVDECGAQALGAPGALVQLRGSQCRGDPLGGQLQHHLLGLGDVPLLEPHALEHALERASAEQRHPEDGPRADRLVRLDEELALLYVVNDGNVADGGNVGREPGSRFQAEARGLGEQVLGSAHGPKPHAAVLGDEEHRHRGTHDVTKGAQQLVHEVVGTLRAEGRRHDVEEAVELLVEPGELGHQRLALDLALLAAGDVAHDAHRYALAIHVRADRAHLDRERRAVRTYVYGLEHDPGLEGFPQLCGQALTCLLLAQLGHVRADELLARPSVQRGRRSIRLEDRAVGADHQDRVARMASHRDRAAGHLAVCGSQTARALSVRIGHRTSFPGPASRPRPFPCGPPCR